jgi:elongator complex protein 3
MKKEEKELIERLIMENPTDRNSLMLAKRRLAKLFSIPIVDNAKILKYLKSLPKSRQTDKEKRLIRLLRKRAVRTMSGIAPVAVLTKPYPCPGNCVFCPTEKDVPQSYLSNEPAVMRAIRCSYDPYIQVQDRLRALTDNGHEPNKIELIVIGGTWSYLPENYKYWYIANLFAGANEYRVNKLITEKKGKYQIKASLKVLKEALRVEQKKNEKAAYRIIGLTLETRPDYIDKKELEEMRALGCTRVELGVQIIDDKILEKNKRGNTISDIAHATGLLRDYGFKITYHLMPGLPGATPVLDLKRFQQLFSDERFQPDQIKFYPTVVTAGSELFEWWKKGEYEPYSETELKNLIIACKRVVPEYVRIIRLIRDIPGESIVAGNKITNLRQVMKQEGAECRCIRCREAKEEIIDAKKSEFKVLKYEAAGGVEYFLSIVSLDDKTLFGFCRLRISANNFFGKGPLAMIRELHIYGELVPIGNERKVQHSGLGKRLLREAERIAKNAGCAKIYVISGIGARDYYRKSVYRLAGTYMVKTLRKNVL